MQYCNYSFKGHQMSPNFNEYPAICEDAGIVSDSYFVPLLYCLAECLIDDDCHGVQYGDIHDVTQQPPCLKFTADCPTNAKKPDSESKMYMKTETGNDLNVKKIN